MIFSGGGNPNPTVPGGIGGTEGNDTINGLIKSGEMAKIYDKWFVQPIPPKNTKVGLPASEATKAAWATPNDKPAEEYAKK